MENSSPNMQLMNILSIKGTSGFKDYYGRKDIAKVDMLL